jgi:ABC-type antimicrobial peptide transport system permease subunit
LGAVLLGTFALCALLLSSVGLFGLLHFNVTGRRREIGIRMTLGAAGRRVALDVLAGASKLVATGLVVGLTATLAVNRLIDEIIAGVSGTDPLTYVVVVALIVGVAGVAAFLPARRAARVDPVRALRWE